MWPLTLLHLFDTGQSRAYAPNRRLLRLRAGEEDSEELILSSWTVLVTMEVSSPSGWKFLEFFEHARTRPCKTIGGRRSSVNSSHNEIQKKIGPRCAGRIFFFLDSLLTIESQHRSKVNKLSPFVADLCGVGEGSNGSQMVQHCCTVWICCLEITKAAFPR